tara:strand:+ start:2617 stop:3039 length:423 start_codon:yes stop_codon:yes gene_type:complete
MTVRKKRKPDFRRIRPTHTYTVPELANVLEKNISTVRRWCREGLPVLDQRRPTLIDGAEAKTWLKERWGAKKTRCGSDEAHCLRCRVPRAFLPGTESSRALTQKTSILSGLCVSCGSRINKFQSARATPSPLVPTAIKGR